jgi:hypothetical protein
MGGWTRWQWWTKVRGDQNTKGGEAQNEEEQFDCGFTNSPLNQSKHPLLFKIVWEKDEITSGTVNASIWELPVLLSVMNRKVAFEFVNNTQGCLVNAPTHKSKKGSLATAERKGDKWLEAIFGQVAANLEDGAQWICTYLGKNYEEASKT